MKIRCLNCEVIINGKPYEFADRKSKSPRVTHWCELCASKYTDSYKQVRILQLWRKEYVGKVKVSRGCEIPSGCRFPKDELSAEMLDLDHIDPSKKVASVSEMISNTSKYDWADVVLEISKCRVLCKNHHATIDTTTRKRRGINQKK